MEIEISLTVSFIDYITENALKKLQKKNNSHLVVEHIVCKNIYFGLSIALS